MSERYTRLFTLPENLYVAGSPVVISAGALLKDNQTGRVLAQLKIKSISDRIINAVRIKIASYDIAGESVETEQNYEYLDLNVERNSEFGQKNPIYLSNSSVRSFSVRVTEVFFAEGDPVKIEENEWKSLIVPQNMREYLENDNELIRQYKLDYNVTCKNVFIEDRDLWICSCGNLNKHGEDECHGCGCLYETLKGFSKEILIQSANERVEAEKKAEEERRLKFERKTEEARKKAEIKKQEQKAKRKKAIKITSIVASVIAVCVAIGFATVKFFIPMAKYNSAEKKYQSGEYDTAIATFIELGQFKDSKDRIGEVKYAKANELIKEDKYLEAIAVYDELIKDFSNDYKDVISLRDECLMAVAKEAYSKKDYSSTSKYLFQMTNLDRTSEIYRVTRYNNAFEMAEDDRYYDGFSLLKVLYEEGYKKAKEGIYITGNNALKDKFYPEAVRIFEYLGDYKDSKNKLDVAKYGYVNKYKDNDNENTYEYLKYLKKKNYKDSAKIYKDLYSWKITLLSDYDKKNPIPNYSRYLSLNFKVEGGVPGERIDIYHKDKWPYGYKDKSSWEWKDCYSGDNIGIQWSNGVSSSDGTYLIEFYNADTDEYLGKITIPVGD